MRAEKTWKAITLIELLLASVVILRDIFIPTLVILVMVVISLFIRREKLSALGFKKPKSWPSLIGIALTAALLLQLFDAGVLMPILNRLTGTTIQFSGSATLMGNPQELLIYLAASWTLAALGEEIVYRGYLQKLPIDLLGNNTLGVIASIGLSSLLFGLAHIEQGIVGVIVTAFDALFYSFLKRKFNGNLWLTVLAHGFYNTIGVIVFYFTGPITGLW